MSLLVSIGSAIEYCQTNSIDIPADLYKRAKLAGAVKAESDLASINAGYRTAIINSLIRYFEGGALASSRNQFKRGMVDAFGAAFDLGWTDGGAEMPPEADALAWLNSRVDAEFGFIDGLFSQIKGLRNEEDFDYFAFITARADGYISSVAGVYNAARMYAKKSQPLTWNLGNTEKHCDTCAKLNGKKHKASWYISRNYIPRQAGAAMECGGYKCDCYLTDKDGNTVTI